jgi:hypothetical protein
MAQAEDVIITSRVDNETVATHEIRQNHRMKMLGAEPQLITIESVADTLTLISTSDAFVGDDGVARSLTFLAGMLHDECRQLRGKLYE